MYIRPPYMRGGACFRARTNSPLFFFLIYLLVSSDVYSCGRAQMSFVRAHAWSLSRFRKALERQGHREKNFLSESLVSSRLPSLSLGEEKGCEECLVTAMGGLQCGLSWYELEQPQRKVGSTPPRIVLEESRSASLLAELLKVGVFSMR